MSVTSDIEKKEEKEKSLSLLEPCFHYFVEDYDEYAHFRHTLTVHQFEIEVFLDNHPALNKEGRIVSLVKLSMNRFFATVEPVFDWRNGPNLLCWRPEITMLRYKDEHVHEGSTIGVVILDMMQRMIRLYYDSSTMSGIALDCYEWDHTADATAHLGAFLARGYDVLFKRSRNDFFQLHHEKKVVSLPNRFKLFYRKAIDVD